jgi:hypothetical protein
MSNSESTRATTPKTAKGIVTYVTHRGIYTIFRLGVRIWLYVKKQLHPAHTYIGQEITAKAIKQIKKDKPVYVSDDITVKKDSFKTALSYEDSILRMLKATGRHTLIKKLQASSQKLKKYANDPAKLYFEDYIDIYTLLGILKMHGVCPPARYLALIWLKHIAQEVYANSTNVFAQKPTVTSPPEDTVPLKSLVRLLQQKLLEYGVTPDEVEESKLLHEIHECPYVVVEDNTVYPQKVWNFKQAVLRQLERLGARPLEYQSLKDALTNEKVIAITGRAGTGKTTLVINELKDYTGLVVYTATTGKASRRFPQGITLHKWLGFDGKRFTSSDAYADILVIDEASMLTWQVLNEVFLREWKTLILVGDPEQLPPVGEGYAFRVLLKHIPKVELKEVKRGVMETQVIKVNTTKQALEIVRQIVQSLERQKKEYAVLAPYYDGILGVHNLNRVLAEIVPAERVIITRNYYSDGLVASNGDTGVLLGSNDGIGLIELKTGEIVEVPQKYYTHGYCFSVHKAQGSEWDYVVFVKTGNLSKELITSATTRARKTAFVIDKTVV